MTKLFTIGPVNVDGEVLKLGGEPPPYFRDENFASLVVHVQRGLLDLVGAPEESNAAIITGSGTAAMEAAIINFFDETSRLLVIEGGMFGQRLAQICVAHGIPHTIWSVPLGRAVTVEGLDEFDLADFDGVLMCAHETSTGQRFDIGMVGKRCRENGCLLVVDAISSILADPLDMADMNIDVTVFSSNKGVAVTPGLAFVIATPTALAQRRTPRSFYLNLDSYFVNGKRGHTPFTSACGIIVMLNAQLGRIERQGGAPAIICSVAELAEDFRVRAREAGFSQFPEIPSNAATALVLPDGVAAPLYKAIRDKYNWFINPPAYGLNRDIVKIGHLGDLTKADNAALIAAMVKELNRLASNWRNS